MTTNNKTEIDDTPRKDMIGQEIKQGDIVIMASGHTLVVCKITRLTPKMVRVININSTKHRDKGVLRYANELFKVDDELSTFFILKT